MKTRLLIAALAAQFMAGASAMAGVTPPTLPTPSLVQNAAGDCNAIAQQLAAQYGGKARATTQNRGGQQVCVVVVVVDGKNNERGQRIERVVPLN